MFTHPMRVAFAVVLAGPFGLQLAHADVYTWVDAAGMVNVSNLDPPEGVRVIKTIRAPKTTPREEAARDAARQAEVQALAARVQQLQDEVEQARRQPPVQVEYRAMPAPPGYPPYVDYGPPPVQYAYNPEPPTNYGSVRYLVDELRARLGFRLLSRERCRGARTELPALPSRPRRPPL